MPRSWFPRVRRSSVSASRSVPFSRSRASVRSGDRWCWSAHPRVMGKTAAVADSVRATRDVATSWVSLDESDRDGRRGPSPPCLNSRPRCTWVVHGKPSRCSPESAPGSRAPGEGVLLETRQRRASTRDHPGIRRELTPALNSGRRFVTSLGEAEALVLDAEVALAAGHHQLVRHRVREALEHASHGTLRPLLHASAALLDYLQNRRSSFGALDHTVERVIALAPQPSSSAIAALTEPERDVLQLLPTMLPVDEIAADLAVSRKHSQDPHTRDLPEARRRQPARHCRTGAPRRPAHRLRRRWGSPVPPAREVKMTEPQPRLTGAGALDDAGRALRSVTVAEASTSRGRAGSSSAQS